jgi:AraC family transcriptional regulator
MKLAARQDYIGVQPNAIEVGAALVAPRTVERSIPGVSAKLFAGAGAQVAACEHDRPFITFVVQGIVDEIDESGCVQRIGAGTLSFRPKGMRHAHHFVTDRYAILRAGFSPGIIALGNDRRTDFERPHLIRSGAAVHAAHRIAAEMLEGEEVSSLVLLGMFIELLGEIVRSPSDAINGAPKWLDIACAMLRESAQGNLTIQEVANEVGVHPSHLAKAFRKFVGQSPGEFARKVRLEKACRDLHNTAKPLKLIARESGFADQAHFSRMFKRAFGYVPSAARREAS